MILRSEQIVKYGDGTMKKLEELGEVPEPILFPDTQVEVESGEPTMDLEDYIEDIAADVGSDVKFVTELPEPSVDCLNKLFVIANIGTPETVTIFNAGGDKTEFITTGEEFANPWTKYTSISIQGANLTNGNLWDTITVNNPDSGDVVKITAESGSEQLGEYTLTKNGLTRTKNPYSNTAINMITGVTTGIHTLVAACVLQNASYVWLNVLTGEIID